MPKIKQSEYRELSEHYDNTVDYAIGTMLYLIDMVKERSLSFTEIEDELEEDIKRLKDMKQTKAKIST